MTDPDPHGVRNMTREELHMHAMGQGPDLGKAAHAKAELERQASELQARRDVNQRKFEERLIEQKIEASERITSMQVDAAEHITQKQLSVARASAWAACFAALAAMALTILSGLQLYFMTR